MDINFQGLNILVIGDVMLDVYIQGIVRRISPEAPIPILNQQSVDYKLGGAANVAKNIASLGASAFLIGIIGNDENGLVFKEKLASHASNLIPFLIESDTAITTTKQRFLAEDQHLLRVDIERPTPLNNEYEEKVLRSFSAIIKKFSIDAIMLQDYNKGFLTPSLYAELIRISNENEIPIAIDPKSQPLECYRNASILKPNKLEFYSMLEGLDAEEKLPTVTQQANLICQEYNINEMWITLGSEGLAYANIKGETLTEAAEDIELTDVCGAGDAVFSIIVLAKKLGLDYQSISRLAIRAGAAACSNLGVYSLKPSDLS